METMDINNLIDKLVGREWADKKVSLLLGAGCSRSSGIPGASELARRWLMELGDADRMALSADVISNPPRHYYKICQARWKEPDAIKREISLLTASAVPSLGYVSLAKLLSHGRGRRGAGGIKTILTTNFDNLIEQAFLIYTTGRPIVIPDPALADCLGNHEDDIYIIKLHGDSRYEPRNSETGTESIAENIHKRVADRLRNGILVVLGYGGWDKGVGETIAEWVQQGALEKVIWVDDKVPSDAVMESAAILSVANKFVHVCHADFDAFMVKLSTELATGHVSSASIDMHAFRYHEQWMWRMGLYGDDLRERIRPCDEDFVDYFSYFVSAAEKIGLGALTEARAILDTGYKTYLGNTNYNVFLASVSKCVFQDKKQYGDLCRRAVKLAPDHAGANAELAICCKELRQRGKALQHFERAKELAPSNWNNRLNYCGYLLASQDKFERKKGQDEYNDCARHVFDPRHRLELAFYAYAHNLEHPNPLSDIKVHLKHNRSPNFDLSANVQAVRRRHSEHNFLSMIARGITGSASDATTVIAEIKRRGL